MKQYFSANQLHLQDRTLLAACPAPLLLTYGTDNLLVATHPITNVQHNYQLTANEPYAALTLAPDATHCLLSSNNTLFRYDFANKIQSVVGENIVNGAITALRYSYGGNLVALGSEQGKPLLYGPESGQKLKCRPGHSSKVLQLSFSLNDEFLCSLGQDQQALIYRLCPNDEPQQVARYPITKMSKCEQLKASFHPTKFLVYLPGERYLQKLELIMQRWEFVKMQKLAHQALEIQLTEAPKENTVVTSSTQEVCIWNTRTQQKLFEIEQFSLTRTASLAGTFFGTRDDGMLYRYKRELKQEQPMEIQQEESDKIQFENLEEDKSEEEEDKRKEAEFYQQKKSKADKIITCMPQNPLTSATSSFENQRFLFVNCYGCVIERQESDQTIIEAEFGHENVLRKVVIARNRPILHFDLNPFALVYATQAEFGLKLGPDAEFEAWELSWSGLRGISMGVGWIAVASEQEIRIFDMYGHEIRSIGFDRELIALRSHQNLLAVVYHEGVPMFNSQQLAMQLYLIDSNRTPAHLLSTMQVPIRPGSTLSYFDFSVEGMIITQDSTGGLKAFSLERNDWTSLSVTGMEDTRRAWIIGAKDYELIYWRTSSEDVEPTVAPRFAQKYGMFMIPTIGVYPQGSQEEYQTLLWKRFALDHEKARSRLWGRLKLSRPKQSRHYNLVDSILTEKDIAQKHLELDQQFQTLVQLYLKTNDAFKALHLCMTCVRSLDGLKKMVDLFDYYNRRNLAIQLEEYCDQRQKELEYERMQTFSFIRLRQAAERTIKPRVEDPMKRAGPKRITQSLPSLTQSQNMSQDSLQVSHKMAESNISGQSEAVNPFLKRKDTRESLQAKKKQITEHVQKFGIKKKVEERNLSKRDR